MLLEGVLKALRCIPDQQSKLRKLTIYWKAAACIEEERREERGGGRDAVRRSSGSPLLGGPDVRTYVLCIWFHDFFCLGRTHMCVCALLCVLCALRCARVCVDVLMCACVCFVRLRAARGVACCGLGAASCVCVLRLLRAVWAHLSGRT